MGFVKRMGAINTILDIAEEFFHGQGVIYLRDLSKIQTSNISLCWFYVKWNSMQQNTILAKIKEKMIFLNF